MDKQTFIKILRSGGGSASINRINWSEVLSKLAKRPEPFTVRDVYELVERKRNEMGIRMKLNDWASQGKLAKIKVDGRVYYLHPSQIETPQPNPKK